MRRYARWIALVVLVAMAAPFLASAIGALLSVEPIYVAVILLAGTVVAVIVMARPRGEEGD
ncbi:hypothetical protein [Glycomyces buryatensis]|uniref:Uncharacterized protein n=1 Tax=Glycomyces buryatensis TaxID=2570927 RepID=A0A4S8PUY0_9ACTN|nr:hypothetical protein [Glycomyces buryatensis]THV33552.1 hypothetical protein FAB82_25785 [Glycomyces buryatensis]